jgi:hypothetical protein
MPNKFLLSGTFFQPRRHHHWVGLQARWRPAEHRPQYQRPGKGWHQLITVNHATANRIANDSNIYGVLSAAILLGFANSGVQRQRHLRPRPLLTSVENR